MQRCGRIQVTRLVINWDAVAPDSPIHAHLAASFFGFRRSAAKQLSTRRTPPSNKQRRPPCFALLKMRARAASTHAANRAYACRALRFLYTRAFTSLRDGVPLHMTEARIPRRLFARDETSVLQSAPRRMDANIAAASKTVREMRSLTFAATNLPYLKPLYVRSFSRSQLRCGEATVPAFNEIPLITKSLSCSEDYAIVRTTSDFLPIISAINIFDI